MSKVVGIDLSSRAIDLVALNEDDNRADWVRCELAGKDAWERTLRVRNALLFGDATNLGEAWNSVLAYGDFWDDVYLVAIEAPYGRGQAGTNAILNRVVGAVAASLPAHLRVPERCWVVRPDEWKTGLGLKGKPTDDALDNVAPGWMLIRPAGTLFAPNDAEWEATQQNGRDAYCVAMFARDSNRKAIEAAA